MGLAILAYVILDGFDLGVGILMPLAPRDQQDIMLASIGPFRDANATWLVPGVGILLVAFPHAHGVILTALYLPVAAMPLCLILHGVAVEFRVEASGWHRELWNRLFFFGSLGTAVAQGVMPGGVITGFRNGGGYRWFDFVVGLGLAGAYAMLGATWLIVKTEGDLQGRAMRWARAATVVAAVGVAAIRAGGLDLRVCLRRARLQPVPVPRRRPTDYLAGSRRAGCPLQGGAAFLGEPCGKLTPTPSLRCAPASPSKGRSIPRGTLRMLPLRCSGPSVQ